MQANYGGDMSTRPTSYGPGPVPGGNFQMQGPGYQGQAPGYQPQGPGFQAMPYGSGSYSGSGADIFDVGAASYPTPVCRILRC